MKVIEKQKKISGINIHFYTNNKYFKEDSSDYLIGVSIYNEPIEYGFVIFLFFFTVNFYVKRYSHG